MSNISVATPPSLQAFREPLQECLRSMLLKLDLNAHKRTPEASNIPDIVIKLRDEVKEFEEQYKTDMFDENSLLELADIMNYALLIFIALRNCGVLTPRERMIKEYLRVDPVQGKVYCAKTRAGSQYKVGEEVRGTNRDGYIDIKLQSKRSQSMGVTVPRSHLVWWTATGKWPIGLIDHRNRKRGDDRFENLKDSTFSENGLNKGRKGVLPPFVTSYRPTGRKHLKHYGKFVYQRHYKGTNIRAAYYDTPEEASTKGLKEWQRKAALIDGRKDV